MAGRTITAAYGSLVTLSNPIDNPVYIVGTAALDAGLYGSASADWSITNDGNIRNGVDAGTAAARGSASAVLLASDATIVNHGSIAATGTYGAGIYLAAGGTIANDGTIIGSGTNGYAVYVQGAAASVTNSGTIIGADAGIDLRAGGIVINDAGGLIGGYQKGIALQGGGDATVVNAGTIASTMAGGSAIAFASGYTGRLIIDPGAVFSGKVDGGNTAGSTASSTLELASGTSAGTLSGIGSQYINFAHITIDASATWTLSGSNSFDAGAELTSSGTLINNGSIDTNSIYLLAGTVTNTAGASIHASGQPALYGLPGYAPATVVNAGHIDGFIGVYLQSGGAITNQSSGTISGAGGVGIPGGSGTLINEGSIYGYGGGAYVATGVLTNSATGRITGGGGVRLGAGTAANYGRIIGYTSYGVYLGDASFTNHAGAHVNGLLYGVFTIPSVTTTIVNEGSIGGGSFGVYAYSETTLTNAGTIAATVGPTAVEFSPGYANRLVIDPGAVFTGKVDGGNKLGSTTPSTLELAADGIGTLSGLGSQYIRFGRINIDSAASWILTGSNTLAAGARLTNAGTLTLSNAVLNDSATLVNNGVIVLDPSTLSVAALTGAGSVTIGAGGTLTAQGTVAIGETIDLGGPAAVLKLATPTGFAGIIDGFVTGTNIDLTQVSHNPSDYATLLAGNLLHVVTNSGTFDLQLDPAHDYTGTTFPLTAHGSGTDISASVACFVAGTRIATPDGQVPVETLHPGNCIVTANGAARHVRWIGFRHIDLTRHPAPDRVQPIRILPGALADGVPQRELRLSPDHAVLVDGLLVPARLLINGGTILRTTDCRTVTYYHVELDTHDVLLAEGLPAESYLDTGNRGMFQNADTPTTLHADFAADQHRRVAHSCVPLACTSRQVAPLWQRLTARALLLGFSGTAATRDPRLRIMSGARMIAPSSVDAGCHRFALPATEGSVRLISHSVLANDLRPWEEDRRRLGVMVRRLALRHGHAIQAIPLDHPLLASGWWDVESDRTNVWRWTNGDAALPLSTSAGTVLEVSVARPSPPARIPAQPALTARRSTR